MSVRLATAADVPAILAMAEAFVRESDYGMEFDQERAAAYVARGCDTCALRSAPGCSNGYCAGREDLAPAYGPGHPLRVLPADGGVSCARWLERA